MLPGLEYQYDDEAKDNQYKEEDAFPPSRIFLVPKQRSTHQLPQIASNTQ